jgi:hypothetical protein
LAARCSSRVTSSAIDRGSARIRPACSGSRTCRSTGRIVFSVAHSSDGETIQILRRRESSTALRKPSWSSAQTASDGTNISAEPAADDRRGSGWTVSPEIRKPGRPHRVQQRLELHSAERAARLLVGENFLQADHLHCASSWFD